MYREQICNRANSSVTSIYNEHLQWYSHDHSLHQGYMVGYIYIVPTYGFMQLDCLKKKRERETGLNRQTEF